MKYENAKFFSKIMWIIYILIGLAGITYVKNQENKLPVIEDNFTVNEVTQNNYFEVLEKQEVSSDDEISNEKHSYIYKVEVFEELNNSNYDKIANELKSDLLNSNINLNSLEIQFYLGKDNVYNKIIN